METLDFIQKWETIVAFFLPVIIAMAVRESWGTYQKFWVAFGLVFVFAIITVFISSGAIPWYQAIVEAVFVSITSYVIFWKPSGIADKLESNVNTGKVKVETNHS